MNILKITVVTCCLVISSWLLGILPSYAAIQEDVDYLLEAKECPICVLSDADLSGQDLSKADMKISDLTGANLNGHSSLQAFEG